MHYLLSSLIFLFVNPTPQQVSVEIVSTVAGGKVYLAVYDSAEGFARDAYVADAHAAMGAAHHELDLRLPDAGDYVLAAYQDLNGNGELDRNLLGIPTEPYGFGKLPPSKWRAPAFGEVMTRVSGAERIRIELRHWKEY
ncbi:uncharacterized protein (DUF2141 family) [Lewinella marina]|uniref:DUF2141 domain-containing protein n=1 Tax=Neolewinella marina TaxID=438751 RepID=UPI00142FE57A|nr:DUF2141 domain-containing protein [Neolewinella marina]NJB86954.1 uncharacterized protein (DUF2141 family) [Neolewinella marina]